MATKAQKTKVGVFLLVCAVVIAVGAFLISGRSTEPRSTYYLQFKESILGLGVGSLVEYVGVPVGAVTDIYVTQDGQARVTIKVNDDKVDLYEGVTGSLVMYSIAAGTMAVHLEGGDPNAPILPEEATIPSKGSILANFTRLAEDTLNKVNDVIATLAVSAESLNTAMHGMEEGAVADSLAEIHLLAQDARTFLVTTEETMQTLQGSVKRALDEYTELGKDLKYLSDDVGNTAEDAQAFLKTAQEKLEPLDIARIQNDLDSAVQNFNALTARLNESAGEFTSMAQSVGHDVDNVEYAVRETLQSARAAFDSVSALAQQLQEDPAALLRGRGRPRE